MRNRTRPGDRRAASADTSGGRCSDHRRRHRRRGHDRAGRRRELFRNFFRHHRRHVHVRQAEARHARRSRGPTRERPDRPPPEGRPARLLQIDVGDDGSADFSVRRRFVARIAVDARAGNDVVRIDETNGVFTDTIPTTIDGGAGNDNLAGGTGAERLRGGPGNDVIDGNKGNDRALLGAGNDTFVWDPGDGSDTHRGSGR